MLSVNEVSIKGGCIINIPYEKLLGLRRIDDDLFSDVKLVYLENTETVKKRVDVHLFKKGEDIGNIKDLDYKYLDSVEYYKEVWYCFYIEYDN